LQRKEYTSVRLLWSARFHQKRLFTTAILEHIY
jgi:hypothetical protein